MDLSLNKDGNFLIIIFVKVVYMNQFVKKLFIELKYENIMRVKEVFQLFFS